MAAEPRATRTVLRMDAEIRHVHEDWGRVVLAFSGGLASLILAAVARKRGEVRSVVVGTRGAADVQAALVAKSYLDYPVEVLRPGASRILRTALAIRSADPRLAIADVLSLVPVVLVAERYPAEPVLSGFRLSPRSSYLDRHLSAAAWRSPGPRRRVGAPVSRKIALELADELGLPESFSRSPRRTPAEGSGIGPALRALGHDRHMSVERLLAPVP